MKQIVKLLLISSAVYSLAGCAVLDSRQGVVMKPAEARKAKLKQCVHDFLHEDVPPEASLGICQGIYKRWEGK